MENIPKVSVCIPTYNGARYLPGAIASVLAQTYQDFEVVIVDNASSDSSAELLTELAKQSEKIHVFHNARNLGLAGNLNRCAELARGQFIKYLCVDDLLLPDCLALLVQGLQAHPEAVLACGGRISITDEGKAFGLRHYAAQDGVVPGNMVMSRCLYSRNYIGEPTAVLFRKPDMQFGFREELPQLMDMELWLRMLQTGSLLNIAAPVCSIRFHAGQMTLKNIRSGALVQDNVRVFTEFSNRTDLQVTPMLALRHKILMTYRVWVSRKFITAQTKRDVLRRFGSRLAYPFMPILSSLLLAKRKFSKKTG
ncbi:glycosyltransferase [Azoarcus indigens]|uniref:Glycosyltransferase involved in cell wall biosynthesis n=1 Tax=Azoarcus indigens TaxID=29545 RepID=A0A4R6E3W3_9RHOO|nr:glycosyltransferase family 2 protein [Azoarcus indigens]NMG64674.1 glycosyltransferase [Azoarcus indigens]TDN52503.1 glycosyltransferase involved in cell wall biosynthesis [Azoarcus indigens]